MIQRLFVIDPRESCLILGPRLTGKSSLLQKALSEHKVWKIDLLHLKTRNKYSKNPELFRDDAIYQIKVEKIKIIYIDEIQKMPDLLDEVHSLLEEYRIKVFISGSSPRKLKRGHANLLGGRVPIKYLMPFTVSELKDQFNLDEALMFGLLPGIYLNERAFKKSQLITYVDTYLKEEILAEGIVRNLDPFSRFLEVAALYSAQTLNMANISRESATPIKTVQNYFQILEDTLIAYKLLAWDKTIKKQLALAPKFYFFDNGIVNTLMGRLDAVLDPLQKGHLFEQFIINEFRAHINYKQSMKKIFFWKTKADTEVDLVICGQQKIEVAIEIKYKNKLSSKDYAGLISISEDHPKIKCYMLYLGDSIHKKNENGFITMNYADFLKNIMNKII